MPDGTALPQLWEPACTAASRVRAVDQRHRAAPDFEKHAELGTSEDHDMAPRPHKIRNRSLGLLPHGRPKNSLRKLSVQARYAARASTKRASCPDRGCWDLDPP